MGHCKEHQQCLKRPQGAISKCGHHLLFLILANNAHSRDLLPHSIDGAKKLITKTTINFLFN